MRDELMKCIKRNQVLQVIYMDDSGNVTKRSVRVIKINESTFTAYCYLRDARRTFKVNNLLAAVSVLERVAI